MNSRQAIQKTLKHVKREMENEGSGHDWWHVYRVWKLALKIAKSERGADLTVVQLGALLHDIADWKFNDGDETAGERVAREWLEKISVDQDTITRVCYIIRNTSFKGAGMKDHMNSKEGQIVQDADRLDAIGAIGIARTFTYGGYRGRALYDPSHKPEKHLTFDQYKASSSPTINHFYEKLLLLKKRMHTPEGKRIAEERDAFMQQYLKRFFDEWKGNS